VHSRAPHSDAEAGERSRLGARRIWQVGSIGWYTERRHRQRQNPTTADHPSRNTRRSFAAEAAFLRALAGVEAEWTPANPKRRQLHTSSAPAAPDAGSAVASGSDALLQFAAASPIDHVAASSFNPIVLGTSVWEVMHSVTGLPWWASIPLTTLALRTALLPLTLKARGATINFALMRQATATSHALWDRMQQEQQQASTSGSSRPASSSIGGGGGKNRSLTKNQLTKRYLLYMRKQHGTPSLWWYTANALVQVNVFLSMSAALRQMSTVAWPGFESEGLFWFVNMTKPAVEWGTWATGYGVAGALLPLAVFGAYVRTLEYTTVCESVVGVWGVLWGDVCVRLRIVNGRSCLFGFDCPPLTVHRISISIATPTPTHPTPNKQPTPPARAQSWS